MSHLIRKSLEAGDDVLTGTIEVDETYVGGKPWQTKRNPTSKKQKKVSKHGRGIDKMPVVTVVQRDGKVRAIVTKDVKRNTVFPFIEANVQKSSTIYADEYHLYKTLGSYGFHHDTVKHGKDEFVRGEVHTNTVDGFFSYIKNGIRGAYKHTLDKYLQLYVNEYAFKWNHRNSQSTVFQNLLTSACR